MISIEGLTHRYGPLRALDGVHLQAEAGAVVGLVGPNGAGKSTLMQVLVTLLRPSQGSVRVAGVDVLAQPVEARKVLGYLPERATPYQDLMVWEHLDLYASIAGLSRAEAMGRRKDALEAMGLEGRSEALCRELSKGLKQRVALEAVLFHDPKVLVLDEPTDGLDPGARQGLLARVRTLADEGRTILLSTHVLAELETIADTVVILKEGQVMEQEQDRALRLRLSLRGEDAERALALLLDHPEVALARADGPDIVLELLPEAADGAGVLSGLVAEGVAVTGLRSDDGLDRRVREALTHGEGAP